MTREDNSGVRIELYEGTEDGMARNRASVSSFTVEGALYLDDVLSTFWSALKDFGFVVEGRRLILQDEEYVEDYRGRLPNRYRTDNEDIEAAMENDTASSDYMESL